MPDGMRLNTAQINSWSLSGSTITFQMTSAANSSAYAYAAANSAIAASIIRRLDDIMSLPDGASSQAIANVLQSLGMAVFSISPASHAASSGFTLTITGQGFVPGALAGIGDVANITTAFVSSGSLTMPYSGGSVGAGTYDITVKNPTGPAFTIPAALVLS
jgi:hypothetical protein